MFKITYIIPPRINGNWTIREEMRTREEPYPYVIPPFFGPEIAAILDNNINRMNFEVIDANLYNKNHNWIEKKADKLNPDLVISHLSGYNIPQDRKAAELSYPTIAIITPPSIPRKEAINIYNLKTEYFVKYEMEATLLAAVKEFNAKGKIENTPGLIINRNKKIIDTGSPKSIDDLELPLPKFELFNYNKYLEERKKYEGKKTAIIQTSKGCVGNCRFCSHTKYKSIKLRSPENVIGLLKHLQKKYSIERFELLDSSFSLKLSRAKEICHKLIDSELNLKWFTENRFDLLDEELIALMAKAGCEKIGFGLETANKKMQKKINKKIDLKQAKKVLRLTKKYGIESYLHMTPCIPGETFETLQDSIDFILETRPDKIGTGPLFIIPGSDFYNEFKINGKLLELRWEKLRNWQKNNKLLFKHDNFQTFEQFTTAANWFKYKIKFHKKCWEINFKNLFSKKLIELKNLAKKLVYYSLKKILVQLRL